MERKKFEKVVKNIPEGSVKKACYVLKEYFTAEEKSAVTKEEANKALHIILSYAYETSKFDTFAEKYYCKGDCIFDNKEEFSFCPGEFSLDDEATILCKYYRKNL